MSPLEQALRYIHLTAQAHRAGDHDTARIYAATACRYGALARVAT